MDLFLLCLRWAARAIAAQENMWEGVAVFTAAVAVNQLKGDADPALSATLAQVFVAARIVHPIAYIANIAPLRSVSFVVGFACSTGFSFGTGLRIRAGSCGSSVEMLAITLGSLTFNGAG